MNADLLIKPPVFEIDAKELLTPEGCRRVLALEPTQDVCVFFDGDETEFSGALITIKNRFRRSYFAVRLSRRTKVPRFSALAPVWLLQELYVLPAFFDVADADTLTCRETRKMTQRLLEKGALAKPLPYRDFHRATRKKPSEILRWQTESSLHPFFSVVIPTRNNADFLLNVIRHLFEQDLSREDYEVIVVDDGGDDDSLQKIQALLGPISPQVNFKYIYCPRSQDSEQQFHAGYCRNKGVQHSRGEWLLFLDSDILLPRDFLTELKKQTTTAEVIQCPRHHIQPEKSHPQTNLSSLQRGDVYLEEPGYWGYFFETQDWGRLPHHWRYTCTYCLAVSREALAKVGVFREVFDSYGFEDTDLGYRLCKAGFRFLLWKKWTYHLTPPKEKSRYYHAIWRKQLLLEKTGKIFFLSTLDAEVYNLFEIYMQGESRIKQVVHGLFKI